MEIMIALIVCTGLAGLCVGFLFGFDWGVYSTIKETTHETSTREL